MKDKKKSTAIILAILFGPFAFLYTRRYLKTIVLVMLYAFPLTTLFIHFYSILSVGKAVQHYNLKIAHFKNWIVCKCGITNHHTYIHCSSCGARLKERCLVCYSYVKLADKFCNHCGSKLPRTIIGKIFKKNGIFTKRNADRNGAGLLHYTKDISKS